MLLRVISANTKVSIDSEARTTVLAQVAATYQTNCKSCTARTEATQPADKWQITPDLFEHIEMEIKSHLTKTNGLNTTSTNAKNQHNHTQKLVEGNGGERIDILGAD